MNHITELFCFVDDFCKIFEPMFNAHLVADGLKKRLRATSLSLSELMTLAILFHQSGYRHFKTFYLNYLCQPLRAEFPNLLSYSRCVELMPRCAAPLYALFEIIKGKCPGLSIIDSTPIAVCKLLRAKRHRVFQGVAEFGKTSTGGFFEFKLHSVINHLGDFISIRLTRGNVHDTTPVPDLTKNITGQLYGDKGYISKTLLQKLKEKNVHLITRVRRNMKPIEHSEFDEALLKKRSLVETVFDPLKNLFQIEHSRHRSMPNFIVNLLGGIVAYCLKPCKPKLNLNSTNLQ